MPKNSVNPRLLWRRNLRAFRGIFCFADCVFGRAASTALGGQPKENIMKKALIAATVAVIGLSGAAYAQNQMPSGASNPPPGTSYSGSGSSALPPSTTGTPRAGAVDSTNVTGAQAAAQSKIEAAGFSNVKGLTRSMDGTWTGRGVKNGVEVAVSLDTSGNVMTQ
jgi:hypothetical protein